MRFVCITFSKAFTGKMLHEKLSYSELYSCKRVVGVGRLAEASVLLTSCGRKKLFSGD